MTGEDPSAAVRHDVGVVFSSIGFVVELERHSRYGTPQPMQQVAVQKVPCLL